MVSIHTAFAGSDMWQIRELFCNIKFQSTPPSQAVTQLLPFVDNPKEVSIHTAFAGSDSKLY